MIEPATIGIHVLAVELRERLLWNYTSLRAPYWRFYWNFSGEASVSFEDLETSEVILQPHRGYLIPPDIDFSTRVDAPIDHLFVHFTVETPASSTWSNRRLQAGIREVGSRDANGGSGSPTTAQVETLARAALDGDPRQAQIAAGVVLLAMASAQSQLAPAEPGDPAVGEAVAYIEQNLHRAVPASELARVAACGERTLRRRFYEAFGQTPRAYAIRRRVERACILLHFSNRSIDEIAEETGFCDRFHLTRAFTHNRGMSPALFRRAREELSNDTPG